MPLLHNPFLTGILFVSLIGATTVLAADPKESAPLPEITPETETPPPLPTLEAVLTITQEFFTGLRNYEPGDMLTRNQVKPVFRQLQKAGWTVKAENNILKRVHAETDFLAAQLKTGKGIKFMRRISKMPEGYDRLDRILVMPYGKRNIRDFINSPGGFTMIEYMTTTQGGKNLGKYLSQAQSGKGFNAPTHRIYTETQFIDAIKLAYESEIAQKKQK
tara:strand:- start:566 stop:1219 length:654 start_codon:yes stop_codon:yes gene_type:complete